MKTKKLMAIATVTAAFFAGVGFMQTAEAGFGIKVPKIGNIIKSGNKGTTTEKTQNQNSSSASSSLKEGTISVDVRVVDGSGQPLNEEWVVYMLENPNPEVRTNGASADVKTRARMLGSRPNNQVFRTMAIEGNTINLLVFVKHYGWFTKQVTSSSPLAQYTVVPTKNYPNLWSISFLGNL